MRSSFDEEDAYVASLSDNGGTATGNGGFWGGFLSSAIGAGAGVIQSLNAKDAAKAQAKGNAQLASALNRKPAFDFAKLLPILIGVAAIATIALFFRRGK